MFVCVCVCVLGLGKKRPITEKMDVKLFRKPGRDQQVDSIKGIGQIQVHPDRVKDLLMDTQNRQLKKKIFCTLL